MDDTDGRFVRCLAVILGAEGGFVDHPRDHGGATNHGITRGTLGQWRGHPVSDADVRDMTEEEAAAIYRAQYWHVVGCDQLPAGVDLIVFDCAVNQGTAIAGRFLQQACGVPADGIVGPRTIQAARLRAPAATIQSIGQYRAERYRGTANFDTFGNGWLHRLAHITTLALAGAGAAHDLTGTAA